MPITLGSGYNTFIPLSACKVPTGEIYLTNGLDDPTRYDGIGAAVEDAGIPAPVTAPTIAAGSAGALTGTYIGYVRFIDDEGIPSSLSPVSNSLAVVAKRIDWTGIPTSGNPRVVARELYRNTTGQTSVLYKVTTITNDSATTFSGDNIDDNTLAASGTDLRLLAPDGTIYANRFTPPPVKAVVAYHGNNTFWAGDPVYNQGHVKLTNGVQSVRGFGTRFTPAMAGRKFYVVGQSKEYTISSYNSPTSLTLLENYAGASDSFASYAIKAPRSERCRIYYSYPGEPESVPATSSDVVQQSGEDEDEPVGLMSFGSMLYILMERSIYRWTFQTNPDVDGVIYLNSNRGCINQRCWCRVDGMAFLMDRQGVYAFSGGSPDPVSTDVQNYFRQGGINWRQSKWFHAAAYPGKETVKFFVCLDGSPRPRHALCYNYRRGGWWVEEYPFMISSSSQARIDGQIRLVAGGEHEKIWLTEEEKRLDGPTRGILQAPVTSATLLSVTAEGLDYDPPSIIGSSVEIVAGRGKHQRRKIVGATFGSKRINIDRPWMIHPDETSVVQVAGIRWTWKSGDFELVPEASNREYQIAFKPSDRPAQFDIRTYFNGEDDPVLSSVTLAVGQNCSPGVSCERSSPDTTVITTREQQGGQSSGWEWWRFGANMESRGPTDRFIAVEVTGVTNGDNSSIYSLNIVGVTQ